MRRLGASLILFSLATIAFLATGEPASAQRWAPWESPFGYGSDGPRGLYAPRERFPRYRYDRYDDDDFYDEPGWDEPRARPQPRSRPRASARGGDIRSGGARPQIAAVAPKQVAFPYDYPANSIVIATAERKLYYVLPGNRAYAYAISVGREGFNWSGSEVVSRKQEWPDWHPPKEMRQRDPSLPVKMTGGIRNPLGAKALYLGNTLYRIHGTNDAKSIGRAASSGCFRMLNANVLHLASITPIGTQVTVVPSLGGARQVKAEVETRADAHSVPETDVQAE